MTDSSAANQKRFKYFLSRFWLSANIQKLEVVKETNSFVTLIDRFDCEDRRKKNNLVHDTWESAHTELMRLALRQLDDACMKLHKAQQLVTEVKDMKNPETNQGETNG